MNSLGIKKPLVKIFFLTFILNVTFQYSFSQTNKSKVIYDARTKDWEILTPVPGPEPKINGPKLYGARPDKIFIYRIPCQGQRPILFNCEGLPDGMLLDPNTGIITGRTPSKTGIYELKFIAKNKKGSDSSLFKLVVGDKISLTPPMGWNTWGGHMLKISDTLMRKAADIIVNKGLADVGFQYISIDDCWMRIDQDYYANNQEYYAKRNPNFPYQDYAALTRDECGRILPNKNFPDMKSMTDYIHSLGLKCGIYSSPGKLTCQLFAGSFGFELTDARQYSLWGFDLLKYDLCSAANMINEMKKAFTDESVEISEIALWYPMSIYLLQQDRDILFNLCQYGRQSPWKWAPKINIQTWRIGGDLNHNVKDYFNQAMRIVKDLRSYSKPGQWNDPDFMYLGKICDAKNKMAPPKPIPLNSNQQYQYVSLWSLICAPFFFSANIYEMDDFTVGLLRNSDITGINQDELGHVAEMVKETDQYVILMKKLFNENRIVGLFNKDKLKDQTIDIKWEEIGLCCEHAVRDCWRQKDIGTYKDGISVIVSPDGCAILKVY